MMKNLIVKEQFNRQAEKYANWSIGKNVKNMNGYFDFCAIQPTDNVLDVACGPGEFMVHISPRIAKGCGVDISDKEIGIASALSDDLGLSNVHFDCSDVENLPYADHSFSVVLCRYAFHHFINADIVLKEMIRCCCPGGKISILDIASYKDDFVNEFFETFDRLVDISHNKTLHDHAFNQLYGQNQMEKIRDITIDVELNVQEYIQQAFQEQKNSEKIDNLLKEGEHDPRLAKFLFRKNGDLYFKRHVYLMLGKTI